MKTLKSQSGLTMWGWLIVGSMFITLAYQATLLMGPYSNYFLMNKILDEMPSQNSKKEAKYYIARRAGAENVRLNEKEDITFKNTRGGFTIIVNFEQRVNILNTLDFVITYHREISKGRRN